MISIKTIPLATGLSFWAYIMIEFTYWLHSRQLSKTDDRMHRGVGGIMGLCTAGLQFLGILYSLLVSNSFWLKERSISSNQDTERKLDCLNLTTVLEGQMYHHISVLLHPEPGYHQPSFLLLHFGFLDANSLLPQAWEHGHQQLWCPVSLTFALTERLKVSLLMKT